VHSKKVVVALDDKVLYIFGNHSSNRTFSHSLPSVLTCS
jgi:hypothetical protein